MKVVVQHLQQIHDEHPADPTIHQIHFMVHDHQIAPESGQIAPALAHFGQNKQRRPTPVKRLVNNSS